MIIFQCNSCQQKLSLPEEHRDKAVRCPNCGLAQKAPPPEPFAVQNEPSPVQPGPANPFAPTPGPSRQPTAPLNPYAAGVSDDSIYAMQARRQQLASRMSRLAAALIDIFLYGICVAGYFFAVVIAEQEAAPPFVMTIIVAVGTLAFALIFIMNMVWVSIRGQTIGKRLMNIRIVRGDVPPGFIFGVLLRSWLIFLANQCIPMFGLIDVLMIFSEERRCLHDQIAGTDVIDATGAF